MGNRSFGAGLSREVCRCEREACGINSGAGYRCQLLSSGLGAPKKLLGKPARQYPNCLFGSDEAIHEITLTNTNPVFLRGASRGFVDRICITASTNAVRSDTIRFR